MEIIRTEIDYPVYIIQKDIYEKEHELAVLNEATIQRKAEELYRANIQNNNLSVTVHIGGTESMFNLCEPISVIRDVDIEGCFAHLEINEAVKRAVVTELDVHVRESFKNYKLEVQEYWKQLNSQREKLYKLKLRIYSCLCFSLLLIFIIMGLYQLFCS